MTFVQVVSIFLLQLCCACSNPEHDVQDIKQYEVTKIKHNQLHWIDDVQVPIYPTNGKLEFDAFGRTYKLWFRKHFELFTSDFAILDGVNAAASHTNRQDAKNCHYLADVTNDLSGYGFGSFSACQGRGIRGLIYAFNESIIIEPKALHINASFNRNHKIDDEYVVYKQNDVDVDMNQLSHDCGVSNLFDKKEHHHLNYNHGRVLKFQSMYGDDDWYDELIESTIDIVSPVAALYLNTDWGNDIGQIQIVLSNIVNWLDWDDVESYEPTSYVNSEASNGGDACPSSEKDLFDASRLGDNDYCEIDFDSYLANFNSWLETEAPEHDNAQLLSYYDLYSSVISYSSFPGICLSHQSGGINQATFHNSYISRIVAHSIGHNLGMQHDGTGNSCDDSYIMASSSSPKGYTPTTFSSCSISYVEQFFQDYSNVLTCLSNRPYETEYSVCGNGFVEDGEQCDCGQNNCDGIDSCCDGSRCTLFSDSQCSELEDCCYNCTIMSQESICRKLDPNNNCDISDEYCDGNSSICPQDTFYIEGTACSYLDTNDGLCFDGKCISITEQCYIYEAFYTSINDDNSKYTICSDDKARGFTTDTNCGNLYCIREDSTGSEACSVISSVDFVDGTPCTGTQQCYGDICQCYSGTCYDSDEILTYIWRVGAFGDCSVECKDDDSDTSGTQTRTVECSTQNGTIVGDSNCDSGDKPSTSRDCNDFVCSFCEGYSSTNGPCGDYGVCSESSGSCICDNGYDGTFCDVAPSLHSVRITRKVVNNGTLTVSYRADPCSTIPAQKDGVAITKPEVGISSFNTVYWGETVYVRWNSSGNLDKLAVGLLSFDSDSDIQSIDHDWPVYVGDSLATDNQLCDSRNSTFYDPCYNDTECDDFGFEITNDIHVGVYQIVVRFNDEIEIFSDNITILCSNTYCNKHRHGQCDYNSTSVSCECFDGYYGESCSEFYCAEWQILPPHERYGGWNAFTTSIFYDKCFGNGECIANATSVTDVCSCNEHYSGTYCEYPIDTCGTLADTECETEAASTGVCDWNATLRACMYQECAIYDELQCYLPNNTALCEWNVSGGYCAKITCEGLPECENGAVRRALYDEVSICDAWYCDCRDIRTGYNIDGDYNNTGYWTVSTISTLIRTNTSVDLDLFTCSRCDLDCKHNSTANDECTECENCDASIWGGINCDEYKWIVQFELNLDLNTVIATSDILIQDLAYYFDVGTSRIEIVDLENITNTNTLVTFSYSYDTSDATTSKLLGMDAFTNFKHELKTSGSPVYRGFVMSKANSSRELIWYYPSVDDGDGSDGDGGSNSSGENAEWWIYVTIPLVGILCVVVCGYQYYLRRKSRRASTIEQNAAETTKHTHYNGDTNKMEPQTEGFNDKKTHTITSTTDSPNATLAKEIELVFDSNAKGIDSNGEDSKQVDVDTDVELMFENNSNVDAQTATTTATVGYGKVKTTKSKVKDSNLEQTIGNLRRAVVKAKREIRNNGDINNNENEKAKHLTNIELLVNILNKDKKTRKDESIMMQIEQALKVSNDNELGMDLLDTLETLDLQGYEGQ